MAPGASNSAFILVYDLGTTACKTLLYDVNSGAVVKSTAIEYPTYHPRELWAEQRPIDWWNAVVESTRTVLRGIDPGSVEAIGLSGQMMACLPVNREGNALHNAIIWMDQRSVDEVELIRSRVEEREFYRVTGNRLSPTYPIAKILWLKRNKPEIYEKTHVFLQPKDYIVSKLTGALQTDYTDASLTAMLDIHKKSWAHELLRDIGIDTSKLPEIKSSFEVVGEISGEVANKLGMSKRVPVVVGCGDGVCTTLGAAATELGDSYVYLGASAWISTISEKPVVDSSMRLFNMVYVDPRYYAPIGTMQTAGAALKWFKDNVFLLEKNTADLLGVSPYELIDSEAERSTTGSRGLLFLPYLMGERAPWWSPYARGVLLGFTLSHTRHDIARAVLEGVAFNLGLIAECFAENGIDLGRQVSLIGGGAKSRIWPRILSSILNKALAVLRHKVEVAALGASIVAACAMRIYSSVNEAKKINPAERIVYPDPVEVEAYRKILPLFKRSYVALEQVFEELGKLTEK